MEFSKRAKLKEDALRWCSENGVKPIPMNIIDALDSMGLLSASPAVTIEYVVDAIQRHGELKKVLGQVLEVVSQVLSEEDLQKIRNLARTFKN